MHQYVSSFNGVDDRCVVCWGPMFSNHHLPPYGMNNANETQVGGEHYRSPIQHWDFVWANNLDYFQGQITKYVCRWRNKNGIQDLKKAQHFLEKYIELVQETGQPEQGEDAGPGYVDQDR